MPYRKWYSKSTVHTQELTPPTTFSFFSIDSSYTHISSAFRGGASVALRLYVSAGLWLLLISSLGQCKKWLKHANRVTAAMVAVLARPVGI